MSDGNVVDLDCITSLPIPVEKVLDRAPRDMEEVLIIGVDAEGEYYFASSEPDGPSNLWLLEIAKKRLLELVE